MANIKIDQIIQGRYKVLRSLGTGGMAEVFLAQDIKLNREIALKVIRLDSIPPVKLDEVHKRFEREPIALAQMQHPHIVTIHDFGFFEDEPYFVMDYVSGGTLELLIDAKLDYYEIAALLAPVADALAYAHDRNILHRDVKPANILLTPEGNPVLTDFGISKAISADEKTSLTQAGTSIGTPAYMAPEQWLGNVLPQTDMYALGIVFYQMLTGILPYSDDITMNIALKHMNAAIPKASQECPGLPISVDVFLTRALAKDPHQRFLDMHHFADALRTLAAGKGFELEEPTNIDVTKPDTDETQLTGKLPPKNVQPPQLVTPPPNYQQQFQNGVQQNLVGAVVQPPEKKGMPRWVWLVLGSGVLVLIVIFAGILAILGVFDSGGKPPTEEAAILYELTSIALTEIVQEDQIGDDTADEKVAEEESMEPELPDATKTPTLTPTDEPQIQPTDTPEGYRAGDTKEWPKDGMTMVYISAGEFEMGSEAWKDPDTYTINEGPIHMVYVDTYWIDQTEVTNEQFAAFVQSTGYVTNAEQLGFSKKINSDMTWSEVNGMDWRQPQGSINSYSNNLPVVHVSWNDAQAYCKWAGKRLPTEAEWEKAARGEDGNKYPWGNADASSRLANYNNPGGVPRSVRSYVEGASPYGVYEMAGNVWEVVSDWYEKEYYLETPLDNPQGPNSGTHHIAKGGSYAFNATVIRAAVRVKRGADQSFIDMGFRCVAEP